MLIIIEGVDGSGKTTVAETILKSFKNCLLLKQGNIPKSSDQAQVNILKQTFLDILDLYYKIEDLGYHLILDRYYPSEICYSPILRKYEAIFDPFYELLEKSIINNGIKFKLLWVKTDPNIIKQRLGVRGEDYIKHHMVDALHKNYQDFIGSQSNFSLNDIIVYDNNKSFNKKELISLLTNQIISLDPKDEL